MAYTLTIKDSEDEMSFSLLEVPITDTDTLGASDNTTIDGNVYTDYLYLKKTYSQTFSWLTADDYRKLRGFYTRQYSNAKYPTLTMLDLGVENQPVRLTLTDGGIIDNCGTRKSVKISMRETAQQ